MRFGLASESELESAALVDASASDPDRRLAASWLLQAEIHCAAGRHPEALGFDAIRGVLDVVNLVDLTRGDMIAAGATRRCARMTPSISLSRSGSESTRS